MASSYVFRPMNEEEARAVDSCWRYEAPYDFYDMANDPEGTHHTNGGDYPFSLMTREA